MDNNVYSTVILPLKYVNVVTYCILVKRSKTGQGVVIAVCAILRTTIKYTVHGQRKYFYATLL